ncbi:hypothetical protein EBU99_12550 [bacterium]|nr:hypothetical protein [bacterium]
MKQLKVLSLVLVGVAFIACKPRTFNSGELQSTGSDSFKQQFEVTRFVTCKNSKGQESGGLDFVWRLKKSSGETVSPYILGFAGSAETIEGKKVEFRSVSTIDEPRYPIPQVKPAGSFPVMNYYAVSLQYPTDEVSSGWGYLRVNGNSTSLSDVYGGMLILPKSSEAGAFANRYFIVTKEGSTLEFNCQAFGDANRDRMRTYLVKDGSHGFNGSRGTVVGAGAPAGSPVSTPASTSSTGSLDLRPVGRPANYDVQFRHERIYDCNGNGGVDVIWRKATADGKSLDVQSQYILGVAAQVKDDKNNLLSFSTVSMDGAPAFSAGTQPSSASYLRPAFEFSEEEVKSKLSFHSPIPGLTGRTLASGGTLWIPSESSGNGVAVAISLGASLRGPAYQVTANCTAKSAKIANWLTSCVGRESVGSNSGCQR